MDRKISNKTIYFNIEGYVTSGNANYYYGANMTDGQSPNEYNQGFGAAVIGNQSIDGEIFLK